MGRSRYWERFTVVVSIVLALVPAAGMLVFLLSTGENSIHSDAHIAARFATAIETGGIDAALFLRLIYATGHILLFPLLVQLAVAVFTDLNEFWVVSIGWLSSVIRCLVLFDFLTHTKRGWKRWIFLPILSGLVFLPSQTPLYSFGFASLQYYFSHLGFTIGLWSLVRFPKSGKAVWIAAGAGVFASWSSGIGPLSWPVFALTMVILGYRRLWQWVVMVSAGVVATAPYFYFLTASGYYNSGVRYSPNFFNFKLMLAQLGYAFFRFEPERLRTIGLIGVALLVTGVAACVPVLRHRARALNLSQLTPALMIIVFGLLTIVQIAALRGGLGAHRSAQFLSFWIGLVVLALELLVWWVAARGSATHRLRSWAVCVPAWSVVTLLIVGSFALQATDPEEYVHYLRARAPASASCLRAWRTGPTYCRDLIYLGDYYSLSNYHSVGALIEKGSLSVLGRRQRWTMQGDVVLGAVQGPLSASGETVWVKGRRADQRLPWSSYWRLNLILPVGESAEWTVSLPTNLVWARLESAVTSAELDATPFGTADIGVSVMVLTPQGGDREVLSQVLTPGHHGWRPFTSSLTDLAGSTVTIRFSSRNENGAADTAVVFRYPKIELEVDTSAPPAQARKVIPMNTERSARFPARSSRDLCFNLSNPAQWTRNGLVLQGDEPTGGWLWQVTSMSAQLSSVGNLSIDLSTYSHLIISEQSAGGKGADYDLSFQFANGETRDATLPVYNDQKLHSYSYDLRLLEAPHATLEAMKIIVRSSGFRVAQGTVSLQEMCLVGRSEPGPPAADPAATPDRSVQKEAIP